MNRSDKAFTATEEQLKKGDRGYIFSDGTCTVIVVDDDANRKTLRALKQGDWWDVTGDYIIVGATETSLADLLAQKDKGPRMYLVGSMEVPPEYFPPETH